MKPIAVPYEAIRQARQRQNKSMGTIGGASSNIQLRGTGPAIVDLRVCRCVVLVFF